MFQPSVLVLQDCKHKLSRCSYRVKAQTKALITAARKQSVEVRHFSRKDVQACFAAFGAKNKDEIARAIAQQMPEFASKVPPMRKVWMNEDYRMTLFDALALAVTHYAIETGGKTK